MDNKMKYLILCFVLLLLPISTKAIAATPQQQRDALIETAEAYHRQKVQIQYDSFRKNLYLTPEDATSQHFLYTVCSGFTFGVYYHTLGIEIPDTTEKLLKYAKDNKAQTENILFYSDSPDEMYSSEVLGDVSSDAKEKFVDKWINQVKPGDLFVYSMESDSASDPGHVVLVKSVNLNENRISVMESGGSRYDLTNHKDAFDASGSVQIIDLKNRLYKNYSAMALIRVVTDGTNYINSKNEKATYDGITPAAKSRLDYKDIDIEKTVKISNSSSPIFANIGDKITYTVTITNKSSEDYSKLDIIENVDSNLSIVDAGDFNVEQKQLRKTVSSLASKKSVSLTYIVEVPKNNKLLGKVVVSTGTIANIASPKMEILIGNTLTSAQQTLLKDAFDKLKKTSQVERKFINQIYVDALGYDMKLGELNNLDIISYADSVGSNSVVRNTNIKDTSVTEAIYSNFYGLRIASSTNKDKNLVNGWGHWNAHPTLEVEDRARSLTPTMLVNGDVLLVYNEDENSEDKKMINKSYIYFDNILYRKNTKNEPEQISGEDLTVFLRNIVGDNYILLRPSIALANYGEITDDSSDGDTEDKVVIVPDTLSSYSIISLVAGVICIAGGVSILAITINNKKKRNI